MAQVAAQFDLSDDQQRVAYAAAISEVLASLENAVEREIYTVRAAQAAGLSTEAMQLEVKRAFRRKVNRDRKARERRELNPVSSLQPQQRGLRYENLRSALAEEGVLRLLLQDSSLFTGQSILQEADFSSPLLGKVFSLLWQAHLDGSDMSLSGLSGELTQDEMSHLTAILQKPESSANAAQALADYIRIIREEAGKRSQTPGIDPLLAAQEKYKDKKGYGGKQA